MNAFCGILDTIVSWYVSLLFGMVVYDANYWGLFLHHSDTICHIAPYFVTHMTIFVTYYHTERHKVSQLKVTCYQSLAKSEYVSPRSFTAISMITKDIVVNIMDSIRHWLLISCELHSCPTSATLLPDHMLSNMPDGLLITLGLCIWT